MRKVLWSRPHLPSLADQEGLVSIRYTFSILARRSAQFVTLSYSIFSLLVEYTLKAQARQSEAKNLMRP